MGLGSLQAQRILRKGQRRRAGLKDTPQLHGQPVSHRTQNLLIGPRAKCLQFLLK